MTRRSPSAIAFAASSIVCLLAMSCGSPRSAVTPSIEFTTVPRADAGGPASLEPIAGRVSGARPNQRVVLFARSGGVWWVQPFRSRPFTDIERDSTWKNTIHLGTEYAALLVDANYRPPGTAETLPERGGGVAAVIRAGGSGTFVPPARRMLAFSGYDWEVRQLPSDRHGLNDFDARNVSVDSEGHLHLTVSRRDGRWTSADLQLTRSLGYGTYSFDVRDTSELDPAAALSMYTWDALGSNQNFRELTIDVSRWGNPRNMNGQYVVQPDSVPANVFRFAVPAGLVTHSFRWEPGRVLFKTVRQSRLPRGGAAAAEHLFTAGVPTPGAENPHITLLYDRNAGTPLSKDVEVVVEKFAFLP
ncbi:MAG TPA: hypothetical protein VKD69_23475 [Vicinamibacterales bacterium]|nr:hypothetical protein [Vicinamibacterales bacterium]